jgi:hypothetical protein
MGIIGQQVIPITNLVSLTTHSFLTLNSNKEFKLNLRFLC